MGRHRLTSVLTVFEAASGSMKKILFRWLDQHMQEVLKGTLVALPLRVLSAGLLFGLNILLARILGVNDTGLYYLALTIMTIAINIATLGLGNVLLRHTASGAAQEDWARVMTITRTGTASALVCAIAMTILLFLTAPWLSDFVMRKPELTTPLRWMALTIVPQTQLALHAQMLRGLKKIAIFQSLRGIALPALTMLLLVAIGGSFGANGAIWAYLIASLLTALLAFWLWRKAVKASKHLQGTTSLRALVHSGFPLLQSSLMNLLIHSATTLMLGALSTTAAAAIFAVASRTASLTRLALMAVSSITGPKFAALHSTSDAKALAATSRRSGFLVTLVASPLLLVFIMLPGSIMGLFGDEFIAGASVLLILAVGQFVVVILGTSGHLLMMSGNEKLLRNNIAISAAVNLLLNLSLIPELGAMGAAISVCTAVILRSLLNSIQVYRRLGILPFLIPAQVEQLEKA